MLKTHNKLPKRNFLILILVGFTALSSYATQTDLAKDSRSISSYDLNYEAQFNGMKINAVHRFSQLENGLYEEILEAKGVLGKIKERALYAITNDYQIVASEHSYQRSLIGMKRTEKLRFDWSKSLATYTKGKKKRSIDIETGYMDSMSHKLQLRWDLAAQEEPLTYTVISRGKLKLYTYEVVGKEVITTAIGPLNTTIIQRVEDQESKFTKVWLATDWDYVMVRFQKMERGETQEMAFTGGQVNNQTILPLDINTEN